MSSSRRFTELYHDVYDDALTMQWDWARYSNVLEDISGVLAVVALVVAPATYGLDVVDSVLVRTARYRIQRGRYGRRGSGTGHGCEGQGQPRSAFAFDFAGMGLAGGGRVIEQGLKAARS